MEREEFIDLWNYAFQMLYRNDTSLFRTTAQERSIAGRLAMYLQYGYDPLFERAACIDLEYNREGTETKRPHSNDVKGWIAPDILLHTREVPDNIFYCEVKKSSDSENKDAERTRNAVIERNYQYGVNLFYIGLDCARISVYTSCKPNNMWLQEQKYCFYPQQGMLRKVNPKNLWIYEKQKWKKHPYNSMINEKIFDRYLVEADKE